jgi:hypothetical protein
MEFVARRCGRQTESWENAPKGFRSPRRGEGIEPQPSVLQELAPGIFRARASLLANPLANFVAKFREAIFPCARPGSRRAVRSLSKTAVHDFQAQSLDGKIKGERRIHQPFFLILKRQAQACAKNSSRRRLPICG